MAIDTDFSFRQFRGGPGIKEAVLPVDNLQMLRGFVGDKHQRSWEGSGFNLIWRPNNKQISGPQDFFLELNFTREKLEFTNITGGGIANRGLLQTDVSLGGLAYLQQIKDSFDNSDQHFEPGVWINIPQTSNPNEPPTIARMGSIPHGTTINLQGKAISVKGTPPVFKPASITPFRIGSPDDGDTNLIHFPEETLATASPSRTPTTSVAALTQAQLSNPNLFLSQANTGLTFVSMDVLEVTSDVAPAGSVPDIGGGTDNIAFLTGKGAPPAGGPNASSARVAATFWIERVKDAHGKEFMQLQYTQRVLLNFNGLSWPHITVGTLR
jgi:hypothetical protein